MFNHFVVRLQHKCPHCRFDPGTTVSDDITTESDRVMFLQSIAQSMLVKARIKLNIKRLYAADALAVKDLLKMATLLYKATHSKTDMDEVWCQLNKMTIVCVDWKSCCTSRKTCQECQAMHSSQMQSRPERLVARSLRPE